MSMRWEEATEEKFRQMIAKMPVFLRPAAEKAVSQKAQSFALEEKRQEVTEKDMVNAFFSETPFGFQGLMKNDLVSIGIDYTKYGHGK
jgi:hypothetical protein